MLLAGIRDMGRDVCAPGGGSGSALGAIVGLCVCVWWRRKVRNATNYFTTAGAKPPHRAISQAASTHFHFHLQGVCSRELVLQKHADSRCFTTAMTELSPAPMHSCTLVGRHLH
jgi:hypothetical protein